MVPDLPCDERTYNPWVGWRVCVEWLLAACSLIGPEFSLLTQMPTCQDFEWGSPFGCGCSHIKVTVTCEGPVTVT